ncbi:hypothetical protein AAG570_008369 [Ranatra chinensis]|uniref:small monomeric GTPase n=1 Tax=Ranatra chinensis TaxID=642074 RepID=A0ABD0XUD5_9HEMI
MVLGQTGVGKTALVVRFITRRYIGEYDSSLEKVYTFHTLLDNEMVYFEILDTASQPQETEYLTLEANIRWAEAFILMYSVTDKCSFDECNRLKFLINYNKRRKKMNPSKEGVTEVPVVLVGNKTDQCPERMVSREEGERRSKEIGCICFHEISVRESIEQVWSVFKDVFLLWRVHNKFAKLKRPMGDGHSPDSRHLSNSFPNTNCKNGITHLLSGRWTEVELEEEDEPPNRKSDSDHREEPFRGRASTDGYLVSRPRRWHVSPHSINPHSFTHHADRRMSISMRGNNASC